jgi:hypothetical protein
MNEPMYLYNAINHKTLLQKLMWNEPQTKCNFIQYINRLKINSFKYFKAKKYYYYYYCMNLTKCFFLFFLFFDPQMFNSMQPSLGVI